MTVAAPPCPNCTMRPATAQPSVSERAFEIARQFPRISPAIAQAAIDRGWIR